MTERKKIIAMTSLVLLLAVTALMIFLYSRFAKVEDMEVV